MNALILCNFVLGNFEFPCFDLKLVKQKKLNLDESKNMQYWLTYMLRYCSFLFQKMIASNFQIQKYLTYYENSESGGIGKVSVLSWNGYPPKFFLEAIKSAARGWRCIWPANGSAVVYCCSKKQQEGNDILYVLFFHVRTTIVDVKHRNSSCRIHFHSRTFKISIGSRSR